ncbi:MAG: glycosyltransferase family 39 protein [Chloroflexi bacterium]|nr:glycosyltransferase family 39 protein [Chloroflexota bacterium]
MTAPIAESSKGLSSRGKQRWLNRQELLSLVGLLLVGLLLRLYHSAEPSLWLDELWSVYLTRLPVDQMLNLVKQVDLHPPLYYFILRGLAPLGQSELILRLTSTLFDLMALLPLYLLARRLAGSRTAWLACSLFTISSLHVLYAQNVRMYTLLATLLLCSYVLFWQLVSEPKPARWVFGAYLLVNVLTLYLNNFTGLFLANQGLILLVLFRTRRNFLRMGLLWAILGLIYLPWLATLLTQYGNNNIFHTPSLFELLDSFASFGGADHVNGPLHFNLLVVEQPWLVLGMVILTIAGLRRLATRKPERAFLLLFWLVPLLIAWSLSQIKPVYADRAFMASSFPFFIILASAFNDFDFRRIWVNWKSLTFEKGLILVGGGLLIWLAGLSLWVLLVGGGYIRHDVRGLTLEAARQLADSPGEQAYLLFTAFAGAPPPLFDYYAPAGARGVEYGFPSEVEQRLSKGPGRVCGVFTALGSTFNEPEKQRDPQVQTAKLQEWLAARPTTRLIFEGRFPDDTLQLRCWQF